MKKMLLVFAHPGDESFLCGGTIAMYAKLGFQIDLISVTNGEEGSTKQSELRKAGDILGLSSITFFDQKNKKLRELTPGTLEDLINEKIMKLTPDIIITFDTLGVNNDPDHIKVSYATTYAFQKYAENIDHLKNPAVYVKGRGKIWKKEEYQRTFSEIAKTDEPKLYYACIPKNEIGYLQKMEQIPTQSYGLPWKGTPDKMVTTVIDIGKEKLMKGKALLCYETEEEKVDAYISFPTNPLVDREYFILRMQGIHEVFMGKTDRVSNAL